MAADKPIRYACLMLVGNTNKWSQLLEVIDKRDIINHPHKDNALGLEDEPHVTCLYGLHDEVILDNIKKFTKSIDKPINVELTGISHFSNENFDVVKFDVKSDLLDSLNKSLRTLPHTNDHPEYHPHMTLGYVEKGSGKKYDQVFTEPASILLNKWKFSDANKKATFWEVKENKHKKRLPKFEDFNL